MSEDRDQRMRDLGFTVIKGRGTKVIVGKQAVGLAAQMRNKTAEPGAEARDGNDEIRED